MIKQCRSYLAVLTWEKYNDLISLSLNVGCFIICTILLWQGIGRDVIMTIYSAFFAVSIVGLGQKDKGKYLYVCLALEVLMWIMIGVSFLMDKS